MTQALPSCDERPPLVRLLDEESGSDRLLSSLGVARDALPRELLDAALLAPLREFLARPSKQFRLHLVESAWRLAGGRGRFPADVALAVELLHAGSLVIDDIQDGSESRRGGPALHRTLGEPLAINAGNWLYFLAERLLRQFELGAAIELELRRSMTDSVLRCHYGQALDLACRMSALAQRQVPGVVRATTHLKTGSLMELSTRMGALLAGAEPNALVAIGEFGASLGVGLQMLDDLSGLYSERCRHKGEEDLLQGRPTWPWAILAETLSALEFSRLQQRAREVEQGRANAEPLLDALRVALAGQGQARVNEHLQHALAALRTQLGSSREMDRVAADVARLVKSYV